MDRTSDCIALLERELRHGRLNLFGDFVPEAGIQRESQFKDAFERGLVVGDFIVRGAGAKLVNVVPVDRFHQFFQAPLQTSPVRQVLGSRQQGLDGLVEVAPRVIEPALLETTLAGCEPVVCLLDQEVGIAGTGKLGKGRRKGGNFVGIQILSQARRLDDRRRRSLYRAGRGQKKRSELLGKGRRKGGNFVGIQILSQARRLDDRRVRSLYRAGRRQKKRSELLGTRSSTGGYQYETASD